MLQSSLLRVHSFSTHAKFSEKLTFLAYQGVRNVSFSESFWYVLNDPEEFETRIYFFCTKT